MRARLRVWIERGRAYERQPSLVSWPAVAGLLLIAQACEVPALVALAGVPLALVVVAVAVRLRAPRLPTLVSLVASAAVFAGEGRSPEDLIAGGMVVVYGLGELNHRLRRRAGRAPVGEPGDGGSDAVADAPGR